MNCKDCKHAWGDSCWHRLSPDTCEDAIKAIEKAEAIKDMAYMHKQVTRFLGKEPKQHRLKGVTT